MKRKSKVEELDLTTHTVIKRSVKFTRASVTEALRDYLHKHNKEVPPPDADLYIHDLCFRGIDECASLSWSERMGCRDE